MPSRDNRHHETGEDLVAFGPAVSNVIPGEAVIILEEGVADSFSSSVPAGPTRGLVGTAAAFGITALDDVLSDLEVSSISAVHTPAPPAVRQGLAVTAGDTPHAAAYKIRYSADTPVEEAVARLADLNEVRVAEPNRYREASVIPNDPDYPQQWGLAKINCPDAWDRTTGSSGVTVAVVDSGIDLNHPQLAPLLLQGRDLVDLGPNPVAPPGWVFEGDFAGVDSDPQDEVGHGTHVAGTIACVSNDGIGVAGVTWQCRLLPVRALARMRNLATGRVSGAGSSADIAAAITWATDNGARIINMSLGGDVDTAVERTAVAYAISHGVVVVAAMGNDGTANPGFPAAYPDVVSVGAVDATDRRAAFSQTGPHIDVVAPGVNVLSTYWDDTYASLQGTSMATPHVSGVAALILSCNPNLPADQVRQIIRDTARPLRDNPADPVPNDQFGSGLVDAKAALDRACPPQPSLPVRCPSRIVPCPTLPVRCPPSEVVVCGPSEVVRCPPSRLVLCGPSEVVRCPSLNIRCPSVVACPSEQIYPSVGGRCPSGPVCRPPEQPQPPGEAFETYDPYGYDPYRHDYGE
jgi:subtilisin family serine protease